MRIYINKKIKITCSSTSCSCFSFPCKPNSSSIINTFWNSYRNFLWCLFFTLAITIITRVGYFFTISITLRTGLLYSKETLIGSYSTIPATIWASVWRITWLRSVTFASPTLFRCRKFNILFFSMLSFFKRNW